MTVNFRRSHLLSILKSPCVSSPSHFYQGVSSLEKNKTTATVKTAYGRGRREGGRGGGIGRGRGKKEEKYLPNSWDSLNLQMIQKDKDFNNVLLINEYSIFLHFPGFPFTNVLFQMYKFQLYKSNFNKFHMYKYSNFAKFITGYFLLVL